MVSARLQVREELGPRLKGHNTGCAPIPKSGVWVLGKGTSTNLPFSLTAESLLLNTVSVPAHFVALNGGKLNVNLKTGTEVRVSGLGFSGEMGGSPLDITQNGSASFSSGCFLHLTLSHPSSRV